MKYNNSMKKVAMPLIVAIAMAAGVLIGKYSTILSDNRLAMEYIHQISSGSAPSSTKLGKVLSLIENKYVDNVDLDSISESMIPELLKELDPHSSFVPAEDAARANEHIDGEFDGIGVVFNMATDTLIIQSVVPKGPSEKVGMLAGDRIITVGDSTIAGVKKDQMDVVKMLKGPRGTKVTLGVERRGADGLLSFEVTRDKIPVKSVDAAFMLAPKVGYIKLLQFSKNSHQEFVNGVKMLKEQGMEHLIFDLTGNSGGLLDQGIRIANEFLPKERLIVYTEGARSQKMMQYSDGSGNFVNEDVILLIDEGSASASEIVAGALQDNDLGTLVGRRSFGKGLVQQQLPFSDGSFMNLTIARYHTPTGRCIQSSYAQGTDQYHSDIIKRYSASELLHVDSIKMIDSLKFTTPKGKIVYGGGGIMPDVFVPVDTVSYTRFAKEAVASNSLFLYALNYVEAHRDEFSSIESIDDLRAYFDGKDEAMYSGFMSYLKKNKPKIYNKYARDVESRDFITTLIKAYVARYTPMEDNGFYLYYNDIDNIVSKALDVAKEHIN